jgi:ribonuclease HI
MNLFEATSAVPKVEGTLHFDGSCWPNPGPNARCAFILRMKGKCIERTVPLGDGTNNIAEYQGLLHGLRAALDEGCTHLEVYGDSQLVIYGVRRMKPSKGGKPHLEKLKAEAQDLVRKFVHVDLNWICREQNTEADALSTKVEDAATFR